MSRTALATDRIALNFTVQELVSSDTAAVRGIDNSLPIILMHNARHLGAALQGVRDALAIHRGAVCPIVITSGYRSPKLNKAVGGSVTSAHLNALAADIFTPTYSADSLFHFLRQNESGLVFDQVILTPFSFVHVGMASPYAVPRQQFLIKKTENLAFGRKRISYQSVGRLS